MITGWSRGDRGLLGSCCSKPAGRNTGACVLARTGNLCASPGSALGSPSPYEERREKECLLNPKLSVLLAVPKERSWAELDTGFEKKGEKKDPLQKPWAISGRLLRTSCWWAS